MAAEELRALAGRGGGGGPWLVVAAERGAASGSGRALLEGVWRAVWGAEAAAGGLPGGPRRVAASVRGGGRRWGGCRLGLVVFGAGATGRARREVLRDVQGQLSPGAALVAALLLPDDDHDADGAEAEAARLRLEALLRRACSRAGLPDEALQAALYRPGGPPHALRAAALRALRAALQTPPHGGVELEKPRLPAFLRCFPWGRRSQKAAGRLGEPEDASGDDGLQGIEEGLALTNLAPNGNCEEICGVAGS